MAVHYKKDTIIYQIYPRSYQDSNGDGIGDLRGIISRLDYIQSLGVNTIWLSPIYKSPNDDNGCDIADYTAVQPEFGTLEDFDELVAQARARGIGIGMDLVINHTSDEHEWFQRALAGEEKYRNYYIIEKGKDGKVPNNWGNFLAERPWTRFGDGGAYYLHLFSKKQPDLNWRSPDVMAEIKAIMRFWLDRGVVGLRCAAINVIYKNSLADGRKRLMLTGQEHYVSTEGCHEILRTLRRDVLEPYGAFAVGEAVLVDLARAKELCDPQRGELDMVFSFEHLKCDQVVAKWFKTWLTPRRLMQTLTRWQTGLGWNACYFENHDQPRFISRFRDLGKFRRKASKMMAGLLMTMRGTPFVYEGQEIGMVNGDFENLDEVMDRESHDVDARAKGLHLPGWLRWKMIRRTSRDNARTPMQWSARANAGFTEGTPWLKVNGNYKKVNVEKELNTPGGVFAFWQRMIFLRRTWAVLAEGDFVPVQEGSQIYAFKRVKDGEEVLSMCNMTGRRAKLPSFISQWDVIEVSNYDKHTEGYMMPFEFRLMTKR